MYEIDLSTGRIVAGPSSLPTELVGLAPESLADLSAALSPCPKRYQDRGFWPARHEARAFDPATQRLSDQADETPDPATKTVVVTPFVVSLTPAEIAAAAEAAKPPVPAAVTNFQARAALLAAGLFAQVDAAMKAQPPDSAAYQAWEYANEITRNGTLVNSVAETLGLTAAQLDDLFRQAATIEA